jgi:hypothetical protein
MTHTLLPLSFEHRAGTLRCGFHGEGEPLVLVLVHGTPWSSFNWRHLIAPPAQQHRHCARGQRLRGRRCGAGAQ